MKNIISFCERIIFTFFFTIVSARLAFADDEASGCSTLNEYANDGIGENFILKKPYEFVAKACTDVASISWDVFSKPLMGVVALGFGIYAAVYTLKNIGSFSQQDVSAYLSNEKTGIFPLAVKAGIIVWLLGNNEFIYSNLIGPIVSGGLELGILLGKTNTLTMDSFERTSGMKELFDQIIKTAISFNDQVYAIVARGRLMLCLAVSPSSIIDWYFSLIPFGLIVFFFGWFIVIGISFYMIDVLLRFGVGCIILPFAIACSMSKLTINYAKKTWILFINTTFNFIILGVIILISVEMLDRVINGGDDNGMFSDPNKRFTQADIEAFVDKLDLTMLTLTVICSQIVYKLFSDVGSIVDTLVGGGSVGAIGKSVGAQIEQKARGVAAAPLREVGKFTKAVKQEAVATGSNKLKNTKAGQGFIKYGDKLKHFTKGKVLGLE